MLTTEEQAEHNKKLVSLAQKMTSQIMAIKFNNLWIDCDFANTNAVLLPLFTCYINPPTISAKNILSFPIHESMEIEDVKKMLSELLTVIKQDDFDAVKKYRESME